MNSKQFNVFKNTFYGIEDLWYEKMQVIKVDNFSDKSFSINKPIVSDLKSELKNEKVKINL